MYWRALAAAAGGYLLASVLPVPLVALWPMEAADAVLAAMALSFVVYTAAIMAAFTVRGEFFRKSMARLHTWMGLLFGWLLYFMFVTGTTGYLDTEIDRWMRPELPAARYPLAADAVLPKALAFLESRSPDAQRWTISLPVDRNDPYLRVAWRSVRGAGPGGSGAAFLDAATGQEMASRDTGGGQALYRMHWVLHYVPLAVAEWLVGIATMFMLVAIVTGVVVHRRIFADFFTFRRGKGQRSWLDAHNIASVISLPFQLMITYSGLIFMMFTYMPLVVAAWYGPGDRGNDRFMNDLFPSPAQAARARDPAPLVSPGKVVADAQRRLGGVAVTSIEIRNAGNAHARITVVGDFAAGPLRAADILVYDGVSGALLSARTPWQSGPKAFRDVMLGLHEGMFASPYTRMLYVLSGLLGSAMIATGLVLWTVKRRQRVDKHRQPASASLIWIEKLNVAAIFGLPASIACYFWANRLLPPGTADRAEWELHVLFITWLATFIHAALRPARKAWTEQALFAAAASGLLPLLNALTTERHLGASLRQGDWVLAGFDLAMLGIGAAFLAAAWRLRQPGPVKRNIA